MISFPATAIIFTAGVGNDAQIFELLWENYIKIKKHDWGQINWIFVGDKIGPENTGRKFNKSPWSTFYNYEIWFCRLKHTKQMNED